RAIAEAKNHDKALAAAFVDPASEIPGLVEKGELLTITTAQAVAAGFATQAETLAEAIAERGFEQWPIVRADGLRSFLRDVPVVPTEAADGEAEAVGVAGADEKAAPRGDGLFSRAEEETFAGKIVVIKIEETDELTLKSRFAWFDRAINKASDDGASAVILDMNTPGGRLWETQDLMMSILAKAQCPTITFVNPNAISAGAMIAISTDHGSRVSHRCRDRG
ncbi:MAG: hypothetical protein O3C21_14750, partial [Verrucomicrobia bacterium]|nr:hypothetical protein [Verrucomicrobiota bacterium]